MDSFKILKKISEIKIFFQKNWCVEFMSQVERKKIEDTAKEAGIHEDDIANIVELEMKMNIVYNESRDGDVMNEILVVE